MDFILHIILFIIGLFFLLYLIGKITELVKKTKSALPPKNIEITSGIQKKAPKDKMDYYNDLESRKKINSSLLKPNLETADPNNFFYNKKVVFTGDLETISRKEAAEIIYKMGADINTNISKKTNIVILGHNPGPSKLKQIETINSNGEIIQILSEEEFLQKIKANT
ncbi:BRCT domain-containing protein [Myroides odoratus]|uniref:DNA ligase n=1 Tax=Myroides odoratus TaxID=256 RepID=A0A378RSF8_MYROD|nr:BRCT domain-containing protein [Myroides odoratus]QQU04005.1 BRCT domain-containing protein [Myroides odoratus]STZ28610.1 DNA ligase [Myroides odoratus]